MQTDARNLSLMTFPQHWTGTELIVNLLLVPTGDPTAPVGSELPFSQAQPVLRAVLLPRLDKPCWDPTVASSLVPLPLSYVSPPSLVECPGLPQPAFKSEIFQGLAKQFAPTVPSTRLVSQGNVRKDLPPSFQAAAGVGTPDSAKFTSGTGYDCDLRRNQADLGQVRQRDMQWGEVFSFALRQPLIAEAIGMTYYNIHIKVDPAQVGAGGWLWVEIDTSTTSNWYATLVKSASSSPYYQQPVRSYAARLPPLSADQKLFGAVLFPTFPTLPKTASSVLDETQVEADAYVDGFAKIVHAFQPDTADAIVGKDRTLVPGTDAGVQIGWDDIQVTTWLQRQVQTARDLAQQNPADEFPLGVQGYRIDTRVVSEGSGDPPATPPAWHSLVTVNASVTAGDTYSASGLQESLVEPTPIRNGASESFWLPRYFAHWRGRSLVVKDRYAYAFSGGQAPPTYPQKPDAPQFGGSLSESIDVGLRYGQCYQFRARLADLTGGGPTVTDDAPDAGVATLPFFRYVPPKTVGVTTDDGKSPRTITVTRPRLNYPEMVFAGAATQDDLDALMTHFQNGDIQSVSMPDPDVVILEVIVEARAPVADTGQPASLVDMSIPPDRGELDDGYRVVYRHQVPFTADQVILTIEPAPCSQIRLSPLPSAESATLPVPTGRNLRLRLRGLGSGVPAYWGSTVASTGLVTDLFARYEAPAETGVLVGADVPASLPLQLQAFYLREDPSLPTQVVVADAVERALHSSNLAPHVAVGLTKSLAREFQSTVATPIQNLAQALHLPVNGQTITAPPGRRVLFGAQGTLRHSLSQDLSSITFSSLKDLVGHWIVVIRLTLDRDWTYSGIAQNGPGQTGFVFSGAASRHAHGARLRTTELGRIALPGVVANLATQARGDPAQRDQTDLIFFATVDSTVPANEFPKVTRTAWAVSATFTGAPTTPSVLWSSGDALQLPITVSPHQTPKLVSAGIAESSYVTDPTYASTEQRQRALWFEFDGPPGDPDDDYYFRILSYGPDPLLVSDPHDLPAKAEPALPIDPEWIRMIAAGDRNDDAGVGAMAGLVPAKAPLNSKGQPVHYIVPLPDTMTPADLEMFGFWTMELRVGHTLWSTAQARYGRPLRVTGVQYPPPPLVVNVDRRMISTTTPPKEAIVAFANLAQTVYQEVSLTSPREPQTEIWFLLYAQVKRVDGQAWRNILLEKRPGGLHGKVLGLNSVQPSRSQRTDIPVEGVFLQSEVQTQLRKLGLPPNTPTSVLAVELFNDEASVVRSNSDGARDTMEMSQTPVANMADPLGGELGSRRVLRVSPLTSVRQTC